MRLHFAPEIGDSPLAFFGEALHQDIRGSSLNDRGERHPQHQQGKQVKVSAGNHPVEQEPAGIGQGQSSDPVDDQQYKASGEQPASGPYQRRDLWPYRLQLRNGRFLLVGFISQNYIL